MDSRPPGWRPGCLACEPAVRNLPHCAASSTYAQPTCARWPPWPPRVLFGFQSLIVLLEFGILPHGMMHRFDQQPAHHGVALLADGSQPPPSAAGFLSGIQSEITHQFSAAVEARHRTNGQHERQRGNRPDAWMGHQKNRIVATLRFFQNRAIQLRDRRIAFVGLLLAHFLGSNLRGVPDPKFVTEFREQTLEPVNGPRGFDAHKNRFVRTLQVPVERVGFAALVIQSPFEKQLSGSFPGHGNLLIACMEITSYNQHCSAPFSEPWSSNSCQVYSVEGADAVI